MRGISALVAEIRSWLGFGKPKKPQKSDKSTISSPTLKTSSNCLGREDVHKLDTKRSGASSHSWNGSNGSPPIDSSASDLSEFTWADSPDLGDSGVVSKHHLNLDKPLPALPVEHLKNKNRHNVSFSKVIASAAARNAKPRPPQTN